MLNLIAFSYSPEISLKNEKKNQIHVVWLDLERKVESEII